MMTSTALAAVPAAERLVEGVQLDVEHPGGKIGTMPLLANVEIAIL